MSVDLCCGEGTAERLDVRSHVQTGLDACTGKENKSDFEGRVVFPCVRTNLHVIFVVVIIVRCLHLIYRHPRTC